MRLATVQEIERAIEALTPQQLEELCLWLDQRHRALSAYSLPPGQSSHRLQGRLHQLGVMAWELVSLAPQLLNRSKA